MKAYASRFASCGDGTPEWLVPPVNPNSRATRRNDKPSTSRVAHGIHETRIWGSVAHPVVTVIGLAGALVAALVVVVVPGLSNHKRTRHTAAPGDTAPRAPELGSTPSSLPRTISGPTLPTSSTYVPSTPSTIVPARVGTASTAGGLSSVVETTVECTSVRAEFLTGFDGVTILVMLNNVKGHVSLQVQALIQVPANEPQSFVSLDVASHSLAVQDAKAYRTHRPVSPDLAPAAGSVFVDLGTMTDEKGRAIVTTMQADLALTNDRGEATEALVRFQLTPFVIAADNGSGQIADGLSQAACNEQQAQQALPIP